MDNCGHAVVPDNMIMTRMFYFKCFLFLITGNTLIAQGESQQTESNIEKWVNFNEKLQIQTNGDIRLPFPPVETLAIKYLKEPSLILDIGCETGKNSACLIKNGHRVVILDIAPNAVYYTIENLKKVGLDHGIQASIISSIEDLPPEYGPYKAVIGTYAFSFIPPHLFEQIMRENVLNRVEFDGYFVGGFFGEQHSWAGDPDLSILTTQKLMDLFSFHGFSILEINEQIEEMPAISNGIMTKFHTIDVIAKKTLKMNF